MVQSTWLITCLLIKRTGVMGEGSVLLHAPVVYIPNMFDMLLPVTVHSIVACTSYLVQFVILYSTQIYSLKTMDMYTYSSSCSAEYKSDTTTALKVCTTLQGL